VNYTGRADFYDFPANSNVSICAGENGVCDIYAPPYKTYGSASLFKITIYRPFARASVYQVTPAGSTLLDYWWGS
jgi:hypothetical protein